MTVLNYMYYDDSGASIFVSYDTAKETLCLHGIQDSTPLLIQNAEDRNDPKNGFNDAREGAFARRIASIDSVVYRNWQKEFEAIGGKTMGDWVPDWRKFLKAKLAQNPQFYTVKNLVTHNANDGHVVTK